MNTAVMGLQWGDEGKGKVIDYLSGRFDVVVRFQGGHNAGHTIYYRDRKVILHLIPSGIFSTDTLSVIGNNVVVNPIQLVREIREIQQLGLDPGQLVISSHAPLILPFHQELDIIFEESRYTKIGTTRRGIGPAYEDLAGRRSLFIRDLLMDKKTFSAKVIRLNTYYNQVIQGLGGDPIDPESFIDDYLAAGEFLKPYVKNTPYLLHRLAAEGKSFLFEGAQGTLLDINFGTYPFVTSSNTTVGGIFTGTGLSHKALDRVVGISKAYTTRVGSGPFPSELTGEPGDALRQAGREFGSTTGRPRRVGWLDLVALRYAVMINGVDELFLTKLDVLDDLPVIQMVTRYQTDHSTEPVFDPHMESISQVNPVMTPFDGWQQKTSDLTTYPDLPPAARRYVEFIEEYLKIPVRSISVGGARHQTIDR